MCREIKKAVRKMLMNISGEMNKTKRTTDREIGQKLGISKTVYSNIINEKTMPGIVLWYKIVCMHREIIGDEETNLIINNIHEV